MSSPVWVRSGGKLKAILESFDELTWTRRWNAMSTLTLRARRKIDGAAFLTDSIGDEISIIDDPSSDTPDLTFVIESPRFEVGAGGLGDDIIEVDAVEAGLFHMRIALPPPHELPLSHAESHHEIDTADAESAMRELIDKNVGPGAPAKRQYPNLTIAPNLNAGVTRTWRARFETVLEKLKDWSELSGLGWEVRFDASSGNHVFTVLEGTDRSNKIEFSMRLDNVMSQEWLRAGQDLASIAYVAGQGEGADRTVAEAFDGTGEPEGRDRREIFVDARDLDSSAALEARGDEKLAERRMEESFSVAIDPSGVFAYRSDWDLGDIVTVKNLEWGISKPKRIVAVENRLRAGRGRVERTVTFGKIPKNLRDRIISAVGNQGTARQ